MNKKMLALIGMIITLVFIIVALIGPWFVRSVSGEYYGEESDSRVSLFLTKFESYNKIGDNEETDSEDYDDDFDAKGVFDTTMYITIIALIFGILGIIGILGMMFNFGPQNTMKMLGIIFGILTFIIALVAPIYMMTSLPGELELKTVDGEDAGFFYSESKGGVDYSYGPGYAWYLMLVGAIIALISGIFLFLDKAQGTPIQK